MITRELTALSRHPIARFKGATSDRRKIGREMRKGEIEDRSKGGMGRKEGEVLPVHI